MSRLLNPPKTKHGRIRPADMVRAAEEYVQQKEEREKMDGAESAAPAKGATIEPWSDAEMDAMAEITEADVVAAFGSRTPEMQAILGAKREAK